MTDLAPDHEEHGDDELDGCAIDFREHANSEAVTEMLPLFPDGKKDSVKAAEWRALAEAALGGES